MDLLLKAGADPTAVDPNGRTLLEDTAMFGSGTMVQRLVDALKQVQCHGDRSVNSSGISQRRRDRSLQSAIYNGDERAARILLDYGANPSSAGENGTTPLVASADDGCENLINMLLDRGADPLPCDRFGMSATRYAVQSGCSWGVTRKLYQAVLDAGGDITAASPSSGGPTALLSFAERGCLPAVKFLLSHKVVTDTQSVATALHLALYNYPSDPVSYEEVCRLLIKEINVVNEEFGHTLHVLEPVAGGGTSLHLAAQTGSDTLVQLLLSSGVDDSVLDNEGRSALDIAKLEGHDGIAKLLSEKENLN
ncbi:ndufs2, NADH ubiquinone oxidoreductase 49 kd subunit [Paecilomyces lecythidis]